MSILRKLFGLAPKKTEEPKVEVTATPVVETQAQVVAAPVVEVAPVESQAQGVAPAELIATPEVAPVKKTKKPATPKAPRAKKTKK